jgi:pSer/pThr/pTyr-binding forkhead associated (FHA) protein
MRSFSRRPADQRGFRHEESQQARATPDGLLSRYTSKLETANVRDTTRVADYDRTRGAPPRPRPQRRGTLIVRQGDESDRAFEVRKDRMTIGRSRESDIPLEDEAVSRVHAIVMRDEDGHYLIRDQNSSNGTFVNNQRIGEHVLEDGDEIQVGLMVLEFRQFEPQ